MKNFREEAKELSTHDLLLILEDQKDLYTTEEIAILREELSSRPENALELEREEQERQERIEAEQEMREAALKEEQLQRAVLEAKLNNLRKRGYEGYYEYTTLSLMDDTSGGIATEQISKQLNDYALDGWRLVSVYTNELGHNSTSGGIGGFSAGKNSTIDQNILILERYVKI